MQFKTITNLNIHTMKTTKKFALGLFILTLFSSLTLISNASTEGTKENAPQLNVVEIAIADERFSILVEAVSKADLVDALSAEGPYTIFAPTNDAFNMLFNDLGVSGIQDLTAEQLTPILLYHVVSGKVMAADVKSSKVATLDDKSWLDIEVGASGVTINETTNVIITDVEGTNGVIHVIDAVLIPETKSSKTTKSTSGCN
jgi:transforming growth factor-beta-induced protein